MRGRVLSEDEILTRAKRALSGRVWLGPGLPERLGEWVEAEPELTRHLGNGDQRVDVAVVEVDSLGPDGSTGATLGVHAATVLALSAGPPTFAAEPRGGVRADLWLSAWTLVARTEAGLEVREVAAHVSAREVQARSPASLYAGPGLRPMVRD